MNQGAAVWPGGVDHSGTPRVSCGRLQRIGDLVIRSIDAPYSCSACLSQLVNACVCVAGGVFMLSLRGGGGGGGEGGRQTGREVVIDERPWPGSAWTDKGSRPRHGHWFMCRVMPFLPVCLQTFTHEKRYS